VRILFDQGTPVPLRSMLPGYEVTTAHELGWSKLKNGELLDAAEREGFSVLVTTDRNLRYQQNLKSRRIAIVALTSTSWPRIHRAIDAVVRSLGTVSKGSYSEVEIP
jgi:predicted nuclease of predicted toxin-antitoxin system